MAHKFSALKHEFLLAIIGGIAMLSAACNPPNRSPADTVTTAISAPISSLNPLHATDANTQHINDLVHASLLRIGNQLTPIPYLAESFLIKGNTLEFRLKKNCRFHNNHPLTSKDVEASLKLFSGSDSAFAEIMGRIKQFERLDDYRFRLHLNKPEPDLLSHLTLLKILPKDAYDEQAFKEMPIGAGPYQVRSNSGTEIALEKFSSGCLPEAKMQKLKVKVVRDDLSKYLKMKNGEVDIILNELNFRKIEAIQKDPESPLAALVEDGIAFNYIGVNMQNPRLKDLRVRRALALSLDIPQLIRFKSKNMASQAKNLLPDANYYANKEIPPVERNISEARRLLDEAGYFNGSNSKPLLKISLKTTTNSVAIENARVLVANAREAGIEIDHRAYEWGIFYNDVKTKNTELYLLRWVGVTDPGIYREIFHSNEMERNNRTNYQNSELDKLLDAAQNTWNIPLRKHLFGKVQKLIAEDLPYINLWHIKNTAAFRKNIKGVKLHPSGSWHTFLELYKDQ